MSQWLSALVLAASCTGERTGTDTGSESESAPPPLVETAPLDTALMLWSAEGTLDTLPPDDEVFVVGLPGAIPDAGGLSITNTATGQPGIGFASDDGSFVGVLHGLLGDEVQVLIANEALVRRGPVALEPSNAGPDLPAGALWRVQPGLDSAVLDIDLFADWDLPVVVLQIPSGQVRWWTLGEAAPAVDASTGSRRCAFAVDGERTGLMRCEDAL